MLRHEAVILTIIALACAVVPVACKDEPLPPRLPGPTPDSEPSDQLPSTQPVAPGESPVRRMPKAPHQGRLMPLDDGRGYVEWIIDPQAPSLKAYFLDPAGQPLKNVADPRLFVSTPQGPLPVALRDCGDAQYANACVSATAPPGQADWRNGAIRFQLDGQGQRVLLPGTPAQSAPSDDVDLPTTLPALP